MGVRGLRSQLEKHGKFSILSVGGDPSLTKTRVVIDAASLLLHYKARYTDANSLYEVGYNVLGFKVKRGGRRLIECYDLLLAGCLQSDGCAQPRMWSECGGCI